MMNRDTVLDTLLAKCRSTGQMSKWPALLIKTLRIYEDTAPPLTFAEEVWLRGALHTFREQDK